jgi:hypothetical protein
MIARTDDVADDGWKRLVVCDQLEASDWDVVGGLWAADQVMGCHEEERSHLEYVL